MEPRADIFQIAPELADALDASERAALDHALSEADPELESALEHWMALRRHVAVEPSGEIPSIDMVALYALADEDGALTEVEETRFAHAEVEAAIERHPVLGGIVERIREDRRSFYEMWDDEQGQDNRHSLRVDRDPVSPAQSRVRGANRWVWRGAVAVAMVVFAAALIFIAQRDLGYETVQTAEGETRSLTLPDGSEVQLAPQTTLAFRMIEGQERRVRLSGEALFDVVSAQDNFVVETNEALVTVLGTTFSVATEALATEVVLVRGEVELQGRQVSDQAVRLSPGQRSRVEAGAAPVQPAEAEVTDALEWTGRWYFQARPLPEIAERLSRHYEVEIVVPAELADERVTGAFVQDAPVEETLQTLAAALGTQVERYPNGAFRFAATDG